MEINKGIVIVGNKMKITPTTIESTDLTVPIIQIVDDAGTNVPNINQKIIIKEIDISSAGIRSKGRGKFKGSDVEIEDSNRGLILTASDLTKWLIWVDNNGSVFTTQISASPEVSFSERKTRIETRKTKCETLRVSRGNDLESRLKLVEEILGLI